MKQKIRVFVVAPILLLAFVSSQDQSVEGQKLEQNPWANYQKFARRLNNRNRFNYNRNQKKIASAQPQSVPATINEGTREGKTLRNTFPFNAAASAGHQHQHSASTNGRRTPSGITSAQRFSPPALGTNTRGSRLRGANGDDVALDIGSIAAAGERCIDKVVMVQETEYDDVITCKHSYSEKCHITYATDFTPQQEEKCEENFKKNCFIEYKKVASDDKVTFCYTPLVRNCDTPGPTECSIEYTSQCVTRYHEHDVDEDVADCVDEVEEKCESKTQGYSTTEECTKWPVRKCSVQNTPTKKYSPVTECKKVPFELCGPGACPVEPGPEECQDRTQTVVQEVPQETCSLEPQRICKHVTKLVPHLKARENCIDIPKEVCSRSRTNPRKVEKPVIKKWCYESVVPKPGPPPPRPPPPRPPPTQPPPTRPPVTRKPPPNGNQGNGPRDENGNGFDGNRRCRTRNPDKPPGYCAKKRNDGVCDQECNNKDCGCDGNDCKPEPPTGSYLPPTQGYPKCE